MNQFIFLSTCDTCKSILKEVNLPKDITLRDIKKTPLKPNELKSFKNITGTFRSLLNNRAQKLKNIDKSVLSEEKIFSLLNELLTNNFYKRYPVFIANFISKFFCKTRLIRPNIFQNCRHTKTCSKVIFFNIRFINK